MKRSIRKKTNSAIFDEVLLDHIWRRLEVRPNSPQSKRVRRILDLLLDLKERMGTYGPFHTYGPVLAALEGLTGRYKWGNHISVSHTGVRVGMRGVGQLSEDDLWEYGAVRTLLELVQKPNGLSLLRRCKMCDAVFVANNRGRGRIFHNDACKQRHNDNDPEKRAKKLAYMRKYYADWVKK
jgi:hypothetical protein